MADLSCEYVLTTPGGTINFNAGTFGVDNQYWVADIQGLVQAPLRTPIDDRPYDDGSIGYNFWKAGRDITFDGHFLVQTVPCGPEIVGVWNVMEDNLRIALESIGAAIGVVGTLVWTPTGLSQRTLEVRSKVALECPPDQNYLLRAFHFGLFAEDPDWA